MSRYWLPIILAGALLSSTGGNWTEGSIIGVANDGPASNQILVINLPGTNPMEYPPDTWHTVDVSSLVPADTKAIFLNVKYAITHGTQIESCMIILHLRNYGAAPARTEVSKSTASIGLIRGNYTDWVAVRDGKFEFRWERWPKAGVYPEHCALGMSMQASAYLR